MTVNRQSDYSEALASNNRAWSEVNKRLKRYRIHQYLLRTILALAAMAWLLLNFNYDKTDIVPASVYALLIGLALAAAIADGILYILLVLPAAREMDELNSSPM